MVDEVEFDIMAADENRTDNFECDVCDADSKIKWQSEPSDNAIKALTDKGWLVADNDVFCPSCNPEEPQHTKEYLKENILPLLLVGTKIKLGAQYCEGSHAFKSGQVITLVAGEFDFDNGLYSEIQSAPAIWDEKQKEFDSIYHLFGNDLEDWADCEVVYSPSQEQEAQ